MGWISSLFDHGKKRRSGDPEPKPSKKVSPTSPSQGETRSARKAVAEGYGEMSLVVAASSGKKSEVQALLQAGADMEAKPEDIGVTALCIAALNGHATVVEVLAQAGADKEAKGRDGSRPLHFAALEGHASVVEVLVRAGADKDARDTGGLTPLHIAAFQGYASVVELLVEAGADTKATEANGETPIDIAVRLGHSSVVEILRNKTLQLQARNLLQWGQSGLPRKWVEDHESKWGHSDWIDLLESLRRTEFWPMEEASIGAALEAARENLKDASKAPQPPRPPAGSPQEDISKVLSAAGYKPTYQWPTSEAAAVDLGVEFMLARRTCLDEGTFETGEKNPQPPILCSDDECPCTDRQSLVIGRTAYLYISPAVVDFRKDCRTLLERELKMQKGHEGGGASTVRIFKQGAINPVYLCERGARRRGLDLSVALADAQRVAETGFAPLRPTPRANI